MSKESDSLLAIGIQNYLTLLYKVIKQRLLDFQYELTGHIS